jgi:CRP-like cAMP-binding protein
MLGSGAHFGEQPFLDGMNRQLTVRCQEHCTIYVLPFDKLRTYLDADSSVAADFYRALAHFLSTRLRKVDRELAVIKEHYNR